MKIGPELLRPGFSTQEKDGFFAEFHDDGQLAHFGYYRHGQLASHGLYLEKGQLRGRCEKVTRDSFPEDDGETFEEEFKEWVETWVDEIYRSSDPMLRCSFCEKTQAEVLKIIAGPTSYICNECIGLCNDILSSEIPAQ